MPTLEDGTKSFPAARILIGKEVVTMRENNIYEPVHLVTIITTAGGIFDALANGFTATEKRVRVWWDTAPQDFKKRDPYAGIVPTADNSSADPEK